VYVTLEKFPVNHKSQPLCGVPGNMHRCLLVAEIFSIVTDSLTYYDRKKDVYRLALTCKAFSEPALDAVWRKIDGLRNLIYLLPDDLWHEENAEVGASATNILTLVRLLFSSSRRPA
jgi:hypothetical protein